MENKILFEQTTKILIDSLNDTIRNFEKAYNVAYEYYQSQPLFSITSYKLDFLEDISYFCNYRVRNEIALMCKKLYQQNKNSLFEATPINNIDFIEICDGKKIGYYVSLKEEYMPDLEEAKNAYIEKIIIVVLKSNLLNLPPKFKKYQDYDDKNMIKNITLKDFFEYVCPGEYEVFESYIGRFNYEAEVMLGLTISPVPTKNTLKKKWEKVKSEMQTYFFEDCLREKFNNEEIAKLKTSFTKNNLLSVLNAKYIDSLVSSEWYYDMLKSTDTEMEQTAIVAGYLKSVEQLLFSMMLSKCDELDFKLCVKKSKQNEDKYIPLTKENSSMLLTMARSLLKSISVNFKKNLDDVYINQTIGKKVQDFLDAFFEYTRNGYFHKDNIYSKNEISKIRKETYCALFLLGSAFKFDMNNFKNLSS